MEEVYYNRERGWSFDHLWGCPGQPPERDADPAGGWELRDGSTRGTPPGAGNKKAVQGLTRPERAELGRHSTGKGWVLLPAESERLGPGDRPEWDAHGIRRWGPSCWWLPLDNDRQAGYSEGCCGGRKASTEVLFHPAGVVHMTVALFTTMATPNLLYEKPKAGRNFHTITGQENV